MVGGNTMKITIDIEYPEQFGFANVEVLFPSGNKYSVNGYKVLSAKGKTAEILCFQHGTSYGKFRIPMGLALHM